MLDKKLYHVPRENIAILIALEEDFDFGFMDKLNPGDSIDLEEINYNASRLPRKGVYFFYRKRDKIGKRFDEKGMGPLSLLSKWVQSGNLIEGFRTEYKRLFNEDYGLV